MRLVVLEPAQRFKVEVTDRRSGHSLSVQGSSAAIAIEKLRATLSRPDLVLAPDEDVDIDPWGG